MPAEKLPKLDPDAPGDRDEVIRLLWKAGRRGNVPALRILLEDMDREAPKQTESVIDELARRREVS